MAKNQPQIRLQSKIKRANENASKWPYFMQYCMKEVCVHVMQSPLL